MVINNSILYYLLVCLYCLGGIAGSLLYFNSLIPFLILTCGFVGIIILILKPKLMLFCLILINERFFYLVDYDGKTTIDLMLCIILLMYIKFGKEILHYKFKFKFEILCITFLVVSSMLITYVLHRQPIGLAYHGSKFMFLYILYFPLIIFINKFGVKYILNTVHFIGTTLAGAFILQKMLYPKVIIFNMMYMERFDSVRFFTGMSLIIFASFISLGCFLTVERKKIKYLYLISFFIQVSHLFFVAQTRNLTIALIFVYTIVIILYSKGNVFKKIFSALILISVGFIIFGSFINNIIQSIVGELDLYNTGNGTLYVRMLELDFVWSSIKENTLFGVGFYSGHFSKAPEILGTAYNYYTSDIGIFGFVFYLGMVGLIITLKYSVKLFKQTFIALKVNISIGVILLLFTLYISIISPFNYIYNLEIQIIYLIIFTCILEVAVDKRNLKGISSLINTNNNLS
ncbi:hypothetical protein DOE78_23250 [Bacillus sp. Y1]|nr:hypothetical protein DOE78_23250 [Bacillus sp. Y1]